MPNDIHQVGPLHRGRITILIILAIKLQTEEVIKRLTGVLEQAGSSLDRLVKAQVFLTDLADFEMFDQIWRSYFSVAPARSVVETSGLPLSGARIAIEGIAVVG